VEVTHPESMGRCLEKSGILEMAATMAGDGERRRNSLADYPIIRFSGTFAIYVSASRPSPLRERRLASVSLLHRSRPCIDQSWEFSSSSRRARLRVFFLSRGSSIKEIFLDHEWLPRLRCARAGRLILERRLARRVCRRKSY